MGNDELEKHEIVEDAPITQIITEEFIAKFEKQAELYQEKYLPICLRLTNENDWVSHAAGKFYLQCSGAEKICNPLAITWGSPIVIRHEREDEKGKFYEYEVHGIAESKVLRRFIWTTGNCNSRDAFFVARPGWTSSEGEGDIRKAAFSNWLVNAVTRLAGIRNPTAAMLQKAGLKPDQIQRIDYSGRKTPEADSTKISESQGKRLWSIAKAHDVTDVALRAYLSEYYKLLSINDILRKDYDSIIKWAEMGGPQDRPPEQEG